jgi:hypothetical protein
MAGAMGPSQQDSRSQTGLETDAWPIVASLAQPNQLPPLRIRD